MYCTVGQMSRIMVPTLRNNITANRENNNNNKANANANANANDNSTNPNNSTPTRPSRPVRLPLKLRDHNVMMRVSPKSPSQAKSGHGNNNMPSYDKPNLSRPFIPTLGASAAKAAHRSPLTPRVAGSAPTVSTPPTSRAPRLENKPYGTLREDNNKSTPITSFLSHNITPRSGSRKSRADSTNTTPNGTPNGTQTAQFTNDSSRVAHDPSYGSGLGILGDDSDIPKRPTVSFSTAVSEEEGMKSQAPSNTGDSKFFFASEVKTIQAPRPPLPQSKNSNFFYANGEPIPAPPQSSNASAVGSSVGEERSQSRFFHANGTPDLQTSPSPLFPPPRPSSIVSNSSRMTSPRLAIASLGTSPPIQRPTSPSKLNQYTLVPSLRNVPSLPSPAVSRPHQSGKAQSQSSIGAPRRVSIEGQRVASHGSSASVDLINSKGPLLRKLSGGSSGNATVPTTPFKLTPNSVPASTPEEATGEDTKKQDLPSEPQSPAKAGHSLEHMNELAANARRERKVLDLEITNSSLAAINRTLEREMRKQTAELRRYRRLSRSGRLSIATSTSMRTSLGNLSIDSAEGSQLSGMSEEKGSEEDGESEFSEESIDDGMISPRAMAESDLRHRERDEKRLQLDLSKHQQLLIDSQKMNQSLKRCLGWSEAMITEGKKALEYSVRFNDVELGGRVLALDEIEDENEGMSDIGAHMLKKARLAAANGTPTWVGLGRDDRDSGIELDGTQRELIESQPLYR